MPVKLAIVVDNSGATVRAFELLQDGLRGFIGGLPPNQEVSLLALSPEPQWVVQGTLNRDEVGAAVDRLVVGGDAPALLLDGLTEATDWLSDDPGLSRPVLVVVSGDVATFSSDPATQFESLAERLLRHGVTTHALIMTTPRPASLERQMSVPEALGRDLNNFTGGEYTTILLGSGLEPSLGAFAVRIRTRSRELARQHLIRFERPPGEAPGDVQVTVRRLGARYSVTTDGRVNSLAPERLR